MSAQPVEDWNGHNGPNAPQIGLTPLEKFYNLVGFRAAPFTRTTADQGAIPSSIALRNAYENLSKAAPVTNPRRGRY